MSIWLQNPIVTRSRDDAVVAVFPSNWTATIVGWPGPGRVTFELMNYPRGDILVRVTVDVELERCFADGAERPAREVDALLDDLLARAIGPLVLRPDGACPFCANATAMVPHGVGGVRCAISRAHLPGSRVTAVHQPTARLAGAAHPAGASSAYAHGIPSAMRRVLQASPLLVCLVGCGDWRWGWWRSDGWRLATWSWAGPDSDGWRSTNWWCAR